MSTANPEFEKLFRALFEPLTGFAFKYLQDIDDAKNLVHDVFITFWEKFDQLDANNNHKSYLYTAVRNRCLNAIRDSKNKVPLEAAESHHYTDTTNIESDELAAEIQFGINTLPDKCREIFELSRYEGLKYAAIAERLGISVKTVEAQMSKALKLLRKHLAEFLSLIFFLWRA